MPRIIELYQRLHCGMVEWMRMLVSSKTCIVHTDSLWFVSDLSTLVSLVMAVCKFDCTGRTCGEGEQRKLHPGPVYT
jgi:hypothetical protein